MDDTHTTMVPIGIPKPPRIGSNRTGGTANRMAAAALPGRVIR
jgi:hypothetical protein